MIYINAFLFAGIVCAIGQVIFDIYPYFIKKCGAGASVLIMNFGNMLFLSGIEGFKNLGFIGLFSEFLCKSSLAITATIIFSFLFTLIFKPRD